MPKLPFLLLASLAAMDPSGSCESCDHHDDVPPSTSIPIPPIETDYALAPLDLQTPVEQRVLPNATANEVLALTNNGFRLFRLQAMPNQRFTALFVKNEGVYASDAANVIFSRTEASLEVVTDTRFLVDLCPYGGGYYVATYAPQPAKKRTTQALLHQPSFEAVRVAAAGMRVIDLDRDGNEWTAVLIANEGAEKRTQWFEEQTLETLQALAQQRRARLLAAEPSSGGKFFAIMESLRADETTWLHGNLVADSVPDTTAEISHLPARLSARYVALSMYNNRYIGSLASNGVIPTASKNNDALYTTLDTALTNAVRKHGVPGLSVAITKDGRLVYAKAFGLRDVPNKQPLTPETSLRMASVSKTITMAAVLSLVDDGLITLDTKPFGTIFKSNQDKGYLKDVTVRHLLQHRAGFHLDLAWVSTGAQAMEYNGPLVTPPGQTMFYMNGYFHLLGELVEKVSGKPLFTYVKDRFLTPLGIGRIIFTGKGQGETKYYANIGSDDVEGLDSCGWVKWPDLRLGASSFAASPVDMLRLWNALDGSLPGARLLSEQSLALMRERPSAESPNASTYYGLGMQIWITPDAWEHGGYLPGGTNATLTMQPAKGIKWMWMTNSDAATPGSSIGNDVQVALWNFSNAQTSWPAGDDFSLYGF